MYPANWNYNEESLLKYCYPKSEIVIPPSLPIPYEVTVDHVEYLKVGDIIYFPLQPWQGFYCVDKKVNPFNQEEEFYYYRNCVMSYFSGNDISPNDFGIFFITGNINDNKEWKRIWEEQWEDIEFGSSGHYNGCSNWYTNEWGSHSPTILMDDDMYKGLINDRVLGHFRKIKS